MPAQPPAPAPTPKRSRDAFACSATPSSCWTSSNDTTSPALEATDRALLAERVEWVKATPAAVLWGTQDPPFAASLLRAQSRRLSPPASLSPAEIAAPAATDDAT